MTLQTAAVTEMTTVSAPKSLWVEWLRGYFDGKAHTVGTSSEVFPLADIWFGQGPVKQPLADGAPGCEIRIVWLARGAERVSMVGEGRKLASAYGQYQMWVRARASGKGQDDLLADRVAELLHAILMNDDCRVELARKGICHLEPMSAGAIPSAAWAMRLVGCGAHVEYEVATT